LMKETKSLGMDRLSCRTTAPSKSGCPLTMATTQSSSGAASDFSNSLLGARLRRELFVSVDIPMIDARGNEIHRELTGAAPRPASFRDTVCPSGVSLHQPGGYL